MNIHFPFLCNNLKPKQMKLIKDIASAKFPYDDVYVRNWGDFLSKFNLLPEVTNFSIMSVYSDEVTTSFVNLKPVYMYIEFSCDDNIASYLNSLTNNIAPEDKFIGVTPPISIGASGNNCTSFFVTEISVKPVRWSDCTTHTKFITNRVVIKGYTFYKTNRNGKIEFYDEDDSDK